MAIVVLKQKLDFALQILLMIFLLLKKILIEIMYDDTST